MANPTAPIVLPSVVENLDAPEIFVTELTGGGVHQGNLNLIFSTLRHDHSKNPPAAYRRVTLRLVMPVSALAGAGDFINGLIAGQPVTESGPKPTLN